MEDLRKKALSLKGVSEFGKSNRKGKRFYVIYNGKKIHFGSSIGSAYIDHHDEIKRKNWRARHSQIKNKDGVPFYKIPTSAEFYSWRILW